MRGKQAVSALVLSVALLSACVFSSCGAQQTEQASAPVEEVAVTPTAVVVSKAEKGDIQSEYTYSGKVKPNEEIDVVATVAGKVENLYFDVGDKVEKDDILLHIDTTDLENNLLVLQAQLEAIDANIKTAQTSVDLVNGATMQTQIASAKSALAQAEIAYNDMQTTYEQNKALYESGIISKSDMDKTESGLKNAQIAYEQAKTSYDLLVNEVPKENERKANDALAAAKASRKSVEAQINNAEKSLEDADLKSPISGIIASCNAVEGAMLSQSAGPAFVVINTETVKMSVGVSEQLINRLAIDQTVTAKVSAASDQPFEGRIVQIAPAPNQTGTYDVEIELQNPDGILKSGMFGEVSFAKEKHEDVLVLPRDAVLSSDNENYVFTVENGIAKKTPVSIGLDTGDRIEVVDGLHEGADVVIKGQTYLSDGDPISISSSSEIAKGE